MRSAVFLDRDGTLIEDRGDLSHPDQLHLYPDTIPALRRLARDFALFIVTNQSGVGRGSLRLSEVERVNGHLARILSEAGVPLAAIYTCPHTREEGCACRKPETLFLERARAEHGIDLATSFVLGDHPCDVELAANAGATGIYLLTGHGAKHRGELTCAPLAAEDLTRAVDLVLAEHGARLLRAGGLVAFPTETVYGLGADAAQPLAVERVFLAKGRPIGHPLIVHLAQPGEMSAWTANVSPQAERLAERFWPGPLTLILRRAARIPPVVTGGQDSVGLRVPAHPLAHHLIHRTGSGVAAPSANRFGRLSPTTAEHVRAELGQSVDFIADGGACGVGIESTILDLTQPQRPRLLRPGAISREALADVLGALPEVGGGGVRAPGTLASHYAPAARLRLVPPGQGEAEAAAASAAGARVALLSVRPVSPNRDVLVIPWSEEPAEAARTLYAALREADREAELIVVEAPSPTGLGVALLDRLEKAAAPRER